MGGASTTAPAPAESRDPQVDCPALGLAQRSSLRVESRSQTLATLSSPPPAQSSADREKRRDLHGVDHHLLPASPGTDLNSGHYAYVQWFARFHLHRFAEADDNADRSKADAEETERFFRRVVDAYVEDPG